MTTKSEYRNSWIAKKLDCINLTIPKGKKDIIKAHADSKGESVNALSIGRLMKRWSGKHDRRV